MTKTKVAFTLSCKTFRSALDSCLNRLVQSHSQASQTKLHSYGFTLAEVLITLTILGVVAAITVPGILQNQQQSANRTKIRKALATYEHAVEQMRVIEGLQTVSGGGDKSLDEWAKQNHCANARAYFKIIKDNGPADTDEDKCIFQAADKLWWNISTMSKPIVTLDYKETDTNDCRSKVIMANKKDPCYNKSFYLATETELDPAKGNAFIINDPKGYSCTAMKYSKLISDSDSSCPNAFADCRAIAANDETATTCSADGKTYNIVRPTQEQVDAANKLCTDAMTARSQSTDKCKTLTTDPFYTAVMPDAYDPTKGGVDPKDCAGIGSSYCNESRADRWKAAEAYCTQQGGHVASIAELSAGGHNSGYFWASEESSSIFGYTLSSGSVLHYNKFNTNPKVVCVGN